MRIIRKLAFDAIGQFHAVICDASPDFKKDRSALRRKRRTAASSVPLTKPCRLSLFHVGLRFLGQKEFTAVKLSESPSDFFSYLCLVVNEPLLFGVQHSQSALDDLIRVLVSARLDRLGDQFFMLRSRDDRHTHLPAIVAISALRVHMVAEEAVERNLMPGSRARGPQPARSGAETPWRPVTLHVKAVLL